MSEDATLDRFIDIKEDADPEQSDSELNPKILTGVFEGWDKVTLQDIADNRENSFVDGPFGANLLSEEFHQDGFARIIKLQNIRSGEFIDTNKKYITREKFENLERHAAYPTEIAIAKMAEPVARACILPEFEDRYILAAADVVKLDSGQNFSNTFVMYSLNSYPVWKQAFSRARGTGRKRINLNQLKEVQVPAPPVEEQRKIASVLYNVDQAIQKTEQIINTTKRVKRGMLQNRIFDVDVPQSFERRFGPMVFRIPENWENVRLEDVTTLVTRGKQPTYADDGIPVINQECIYWDGWHFENLRYLDEEVADEWKEKYFPKRGDVTINSTGEGTLGRAQVYSDDERRAVDSHVTIVRPDTEQMLPGYFRYLLESNRGQGLLYSMCVTGSTGQIELSKSKLQLLSIPLPPMEEQHEIAETVQHFDQTISKQQKYKGQLQRLKTALMQDLLSGTVRTTDTNIEILPEVVQHG